VRKRLITQNRALIQALGEGLLDIERAATVEVTSEDKDFPVESVFLVEPREGWRAAEAGPQTIRLLFDKPEELNRISLVFEEKELTRTQEFVLRISSSAGGPLREIVRQQWNFSPPNSMREIEDYRVDLSDVTVVELIIVPDISGGVTHASLNRMQLSSSASCGELSSLSSDTALS